MFENEILVVPDLAAHPELRGMPYVTGEPGFRFYAGAPVETEAGLPVGALCILDTRPRELGAGERASLARLALVAGALLRLQKANLVLVLLIAQIVQVLLLSLAVFAFFIVFGMVAIEDATILSWTGEEPHYAGDLGLVSQELTQVSIFLAAFSDVRHGGAAYAAIDTVSTTKLMSGVELLAGQQESQAAMVQDGAVRGDALQGRPFLK